MMTLRSIRHVTAAVMVAFLLPLSVAQAGQSGKSSVAAKLEVKVLDGQPAGSGGGSDAIYRMEVISVLRSSLRFKTGETIIVRVPGRLKEGAPASFAPGWIGMAYLNPDPKASGAEAGKRFVVVGNGGGLEDLPPTPPSATWIEYVYPDKAAPR